MSDDEDETAAEPVKVKQVAIAAGIVTAALTAAVAFTVAGPLGVGIAAAGVAGTGYTAHRIRNPKTGRPGVLHSWLTRSRRTKTTGGSLTWPFTGNQTKRAQARAGGQSSRSRGLPSLTSTRARRSAALTGTRSNGRPRRSTAFSTGTKPGRKLSTSTSPRSTGRPTGSSLRRGVPGSKPVTPARLTSSKPGLNTRSGQARSKRNSLLSMPSKGRGGSSATRRTSGGIAPTRSSSRRSTPKGLSSLKSIRRLGLSTPGRSSTKRGLNPWRSTRGGRSLGGRSTGSRKTGAARRLGGTLGGAAGRRGRLRNRVTPDVPVRTRLRPRPYRRPTAGKLLRTSLRLPIRQRVPGGRRRVVPFRRPSARQAARARRTLRLRCGIWLRRGAVWLAATPGRRWDRLWAKLPQAPMPLTHYTERAGMKTPTGPKYHRPPVPVPSAVVAARPAVARTHTMIPIQRNGETIYVSDPVDIIIEAFQQLATFHPGSAIEVERVAARQPEMFAEIGRAYSAWADSLTDGQPFEQHFADSVREIGVAVSATGGVAQSAHETMRTVHAADFARIEEPRNDEGMWDRGANS